MDQIEKLVIVFTGMVLIFFILALAQATNEGVGLLPDCIPYGEAYTQPRVEQLDDHTYQVFMSARMWSFDPAEIYLPVGAEVDFFLSSKDVVHGFHIPKKNINLMAVYGAINKTTTRFDTPGVYEIICHEYCGTGHQAMRAEVIVNYPEN